MGRLCDIKSLRELRSLQRENEAAKTAAQKRICANVLKLLSIERYFSIEKLFKFKWWKNRG